MKDAKFIESKSACQQQRCTEKQIYTVCRIITAKLVGYYRDAVIGMAHAVTVTRELSHCLQYHVKCLHARIDWQGKQVLVKCTLM